MQRCLAERQVAVLSPLCGEMLLKGDCLIGVEGLKISKCSEGLEAMQRLGDAVERSLTEAERLAQIGEVPSLDPLVPRVMPGHGFDLHPRTHNSRRAVGSHLCVALPPVSRRRATP